MLVTLIVDASFYDQTKAAAYALYAVSQRGRVIHAGRFKQPIRDSSHAELAAIANALHLVLPHPLAFGATRILIQSDSKNAIKWLEERKCPRHPAVLAHIFGLLERWQVTAEFRYIKAHNGTGQSRYYVHDDCDKRARSLAREMHKERLASGKYGTPSTPRKKKKKAKVVKAAETKA